MTLNLEREKEFVNQYHYDARNLEWEKENGAPENNLNVQLQLLEREEYEKAGENDTVIATILQFMLPMENIVISGFLTQVNYVKDATITEQEQLSQEDMQQLAAPLFDLLKRLVLETTEVALDQPGVQLEF